MEGDPRIDKLMWPVLTAIKRHIKDKDAETEIYNRAYEAIMISMEANEPSKSDVSVSGNVLTDIKTSHPVKSDGSGITFCPNCEAETDCHFDTEIWSCNICGEDFAAYTKPAYAYWHTQAVQAVKHELNLISFLRRCFALDVFRDRPRLRDEGLKLLDGDAR